MNTLIQSRLARHKFKKEPGGGISMTEQAGYIPTNIMVKLMEDSGKMKKAYLASVFRYPPGVYPQEGDVPDPTENPAYDLVDYSKSRMEVAGWMKEKKALAAKAKADKEKKDKEDLEAYRAQKVDGEPKQEGGE